MKPLGNTYANAKASTGGGAQLPPGGYVVVITEAEDFPLNPNTGKGDYLKIEFDICEGEYENHFNEMHARLGWDNGNFIRSYKETAMGMFKAFLQSIDESNGTKYAEKAETGLDESDLRGRILGVVMGEEEYEKKDGSIGKRLRVSYTCSADKVREGDYKTPELKKLEGAPSDSIPSGFTSSTGFDTPFV